MFQDTLGAAHDAALVGYDRGLFSGLTIGLVVGVILAACALLGWLGALSPAEREQLFRHVEGRPDPAGAPPVVPLSTFNGPRFDDAMTAKGATVIRRLEPLPRGWRPTR